MTATTNLERARAAIMDRHRTAAAARFEDLAFMLEHGETLERALERLGTSHDSLRQQARTWGRADVLALLAEAVTR